MIHDIALALSDKVRLRSRRALELSRRLVRYLARASRPARIRFRAWLAGSISDHTHRSHASAPTPWPEYESWLAVNLSTQAARDDLRHALAKHPLHPVFSVLMPVKDSDPDLLSKAIQSVLDQTYAAWELCIVDDGSSSPHALLIAESMATVDSRIRCARLGVTSGISAATNAAAALATGEILAFLDHDDVLASDALAEMALHYLSRPETDIAYSDDDKVDMAGRRFDPQFKPGWSPTLLLSYMYMGHLLTVRRSLFERLGGFRSAYDGSQDYDFCLRATEHAREIGHVPRILYHWRTAPGSTATSGAAKPGAIKAAERAIKQAVARRGLVGLDVVRPRWAQTNDLGLFRLEGGGDLPPISLVLICTAEEAKHWQAKLVAEGPDNSHVHIIRRDLEANAVSALIDTIADLSTPDVAIVWGCQWPEQRDWVSRLATYLRLPGVSLVSAQVIQDGRICAGGVVSGRDGLADTAFLGVAAEAGGYMSLNATVREVVATNGGAFLSTRAELLHHMRDRADLDLPDFEQAYGQALTAAGQRCLIHPGVSMTRAITPDSRQTCRRRRLSIDDPFMNMSLDHARTPYQIVPVHAPPRLTSRMRVALVSHNFNREGASITLRDLAIGLKQAAGVEPIILCPHPGPIMAEYEASGVEVIFVPELVDVSTPSGYLGAKERLAEIFKAKAVNVILANTIRMFPAIRAAADVETPSILYQHESEDWATYFDYLALAVRREAYAAFPTAYAVVHVSEATRRAWRPVESRNNSRMIRNALPPDPQRFGQMTRAEARSALSIAPDEIVFLVVGSVCRRKRQRDVVTAFGGLPASIAVSARLLIVGNFSEPDYVATLIEQIHHDGSSERVEMIGAVERTFTYYAAADVYVCASENESSPRVLLQAMEAALPILTTPVFGIPEITSEGVNSLYFEPGDTATLTAMMSRLASSSTQREEMAAASLELHKERPSFDDMVTAFGQLLDEAAMSSVPELPQESARQG